MKPIQTAPSRADLLVNCQHFPLPSTGRIRTLLLHRASACSTVLLTSSVHKYLTRSVPKHAYKWGSGWLNWCSVAGLEIQRPEVRTPPGAHEKCVRVITYARWVTGWLSW